MNERLMNSVAVMIARISWGRAFLLTKLRIIILG